jgi:hypothetical protein
LIGRSSALIALALLGASCGAPAERPTTPAPGPAEPSPEARARPLRFDYLTLDGKPLSTETVAGRFTLIGFLATYDVASQAEARFLGGLLRRHTPRINVAVLVLESEENLPIVEAFASTLGLEYPVALADGRTIAGQGPFAGLHHVPSVVLLDRQGHEVWRHVGLAEEATIEKALRAAESSDPSR